jgi:activator of 2-hydroxyglutaryl-CoA dehydratase
MQRRSGGLAIIAGGCDIGSVNGKALLLKENKIIARALFRLHQAGGNSSAGNNRGI